MNESTYYDLKNAKQMTSSMAIEVARELGRRIVSGAIEPESLIDDETTLASRFKVSRVVVRDAVKILVGKGLLEVRRGIGTRVRPRERWVLLDDDILAWHLSAPPDRDFLSRLMDVRRAFEPKAARWAAERATDEDLAAIEAACKSMRENLDNVDEFINADAQFHRCVLRAARNEMLTAMEGVIYSALLCMVRITNHDPEDNAASVEFHYKVYEAIAAHKGAQAELLVEKLLQDCDDRLGNEFEINPKA